MAELLTFFGFLLLALACLYVILQLPLAGREPAAGSRTFGARLVRAEVDGDAIVLDGVTLEAGDPFALVLDHPDRATDGTLETWADTGACVDVTITGPSVTVALRSGGNNRRTATAIASRIRA